VEPFRSLGAEALMEETHARVGELLRRERGAGAGRERESAGKPRD
jgi:hypothetical protein